MNADSPWPCPSVAAGLEEPGCSAEEVNGQPPCASSPQPAVLHLPAPKGLLPSPPAQPMSPTKTAALPEGGKSLVLALAVGKGTHAPDVHLRRGAGRKGTHE